MRFKTTGLVMALFLLSAPAWGATDMLTSVGVTVPTNSTCPANALAGRCSAGWFRISGAEKVGVSVSATAGTNTIILEQRFSTTSAVWPLKTWTNATSTQVGIAVWPPVGEIRIRATAVSGGTAKAQLTAVAPSGVELW
jgi:hypothetical protein